MCDEKSIRLSIWLSDRFEELETLQAAFLMLVNKISTKIPTGMKNEEYLAFMQTSVNTVQLMNKLAKELHGVEQAVFSDITSQVKIDIGDSDDDESETLSSKQ